MPPFNSLILITLSRFLPAWLFLRPALEGRRHPHFGLSRLCPWRKALPLPLELGHSPWMHLLIHCTAILNWTIISVLVNTDHSSCIFFSLILASFVSHSAVGSLVSLKGVCVSANAVLSWDEEKNDWQADSPTPTSLIGRNAKECKWIREIGARGETHKIITSIQEIGEAYFTHVSSSLAVNKINPNWKFFPTCFLFTS